MLLQDTHDLRTGALCRDMRGFCWVCVGSTNTDRGLAYIFVRETTGLHGTSKLKERMWTKSFTTASAFNDMMENANDFLR